jgi:putative copper resistance protein D
LQRFSRIGHAVVATVILTGVVNSVLTLCHWPTRPISPYAALLGLKIILVAAMATLAVINRYVFVPRIRFDRVKTIALIKVGTWSEVVLGAGVLTLVATFGVFDPH